VVLVPVLVLVLGWRSRVSEKFRLEGNGLEAELSAFIDHLTHLNPKMAAVFSDHVAILRAATTEDTRRTARAQFNTAVRKRLLDESTDAEVREG